MFNSSNNGKILIFIQILMSLYSFCLNAMTLSPGSLQQSIQKEYKLSTFQYGLLYSLTSWASIFDVFHGYIIDKYWGLRKATLIYNIILVTGAILIIAGNLTRPLSYPLFLIGRLVFGLGCNPLLLCLNGYILYWFAGRKWYNISYAIPESVYWLGLSTVYFASVHLLNWAELHYPASEALGLTIVSETALLCGIMLIVMTIAAILYNKKDDDKENNNVKEAEKQLKFYDYIKLPFIFWVYSFAGIMYYVSIMNFITFSQVYFHKTYGFSISYSSTLTGIFCVITFLFSPVWGFITDRIGHNLTLMTLAFSLNAAVHLLLVFLKCNPLIPLILLAVANSMASTFCNLWAYLVKQHQQLIAYALAQTGVLSSVALGSLIGGIIIDNYGYIGFEYYMLAIITSSYLGLILLWVLDYERGLILQMTPELKEEKFKALLQKQIK